MNLKKTPQQMPGGFALERAAIGSARLRQQRVDQKRWVKRRYGVRP